MNQGIMKIAKGIFLVYLVFLSITLNSVLADSKKAILLFRSKSKPFQVMRDDLVSSLPKYDIKDIVLEEKDTFESFSEKIKANNPAFLILLDNKSVDFGKKFNSQSEKRVHGLAMMSLNLSSILTGVKDLAGVTFETPGFLIVSNYKGSIKKPLKNILVFYRKSLFSAQVDSAAKQLKRDQVKLEAVDVEQSGTSVEDIEKFITSKADFYLSQSDKYDAYWVMLDSALLSQKLFTSVWVPESTKSKIPFITGFEPLINPQMNFAAFAVIPNMSDLAEQGAQIVRRILEENETPESIGVEPLVSVNKIINRKKSKQLGIEFDNERLFDVKILGD